MVKGTILIASTTLSGRKLQLLTQRKEINIVFYSTSRGALEYLIEETPDFVVLDQNLESVPGLDIIRKIRSVKRLHSVPVALLNLGGELELTPPDRKLVDLHIKDSLTESELLDKIHVYDSESEKLQQTNTDLKSTMYLEQAISQLSSHDLPDTSQSLSKAQQMMLSPKERIQYLEIEIERLKAMLSEYQERFGDITDNSNGEKKPWLDVLLKPVF